MKKLFLAFTLLFSGSVLAHEYCHHRFNANLAVSVVVNDRSGANRFGSISWDTANTCAQEIPEGGWVCTEIYPGTFKVRWKDLTPENSEGAVRFKVKSINSKDDLGNRYRRNSQFGRFVRTAKFSSAVIPEPNLTLHWNGQEIEMKCHSMEQPAE